MIPQLLPALVVKAWIRHHPCSAGGTEGTSSPGLQPLPGLAQGLSCSSPLTPKGGFLSSPRSQAPPSPQQTPLPLLPLSNPAVACPTLNAGSFPPLLLLPFD